MASTRSWVQAPNRAQGAPFFLPIVVCRLNLFRCRGNSEIEVIEDGRLGQKLPGLGEEKRVGPGPVRGLVVFFLFFCLPPSRVGLSLGPGRGAVGFSPEASP